METTQLKEWGSTEVFKAILNGNPYFTTDDAGWQGVNAAIVRSTVVFRTPDHPFSLQVTPAGGTPTAIVRFLQASSPRVVPGRPYLLRGWLMAPAALSLGVTAGCFFRWRDAAGNTISTPLGAHVVLAAGVWTLVTVSGIAPSNAYTCQGEFRIVGPPNPVAADVYYLSEGELVDTSQAETANGTARVELAPNSVQYWDVTQIAISTSSNDLEPSARVYKNHVEPTSLISGTFVGSLNSASYTRALRFNQGDSIICEWEGADPGATATLAVLGEKTG